MSFLKLREKSTILLLFTRVERPKALKEIKGYNHVAFGYQLTNEALLVIEPALQGANIDFVYVDELAAKAAEIEILELDVRFTFSTKLFKEQFETCATFVQYLAGIDLGATLAQTLYNRLTKKSLAYLNNKGITEVRKWVLKPQSQLDPSSEEEPQS